MANDNGVDSPYEIRQGYSAVRGEPTFYVARKGTPRREGEQRSLSVFFPTREQAERCIAVLISDDRRHA